MSDFPRVPRQPGRGSRYAGPDPERRARPSAGLSGLPDPEVAPDFYRDVPVKRLVAFIVDSLLIGLISVLLIPFTAFTAIFYLPFLALLVSLAYRGVTLAASSATPGMRLAAIEIRTHRGERLDPFTAVAHTVLFTLFLGTLLPLLISVGMMLLTPRRQGLHDMILGTAALNRPA